jgi:DNA segregation ATPase FtsK/SpoIIIE-like protein
MERRYKLMSAVGVRNLKGYNDKVLAAIEAGIPWSTPCGVRATPWIRCRRSWKNCPTSWWWWIEFADMMMIVGKKVEELIARIAQKARAAGIHLILATQRPSVDVITGLIKANIPTRISFQVSSKIDSRTILDQGAPNPCSAWATCSTCRRHLNPTRVHGAFVDDHEVHKVVADWKLRGEPDYIDEILSGESDGEGGGGDSAVVAMKSSIPCSTRRWPSWWNPPWLHLQRPAQVQDRLQPGGPSHRADGKPGHRQRPGRQWPARRAGPATSSGLSLTPLSSWPCPLRAWPFIETSL